MTDIKPPYIDGGGNEFISMCLFAEALVKQMRQLVKNSYRDDSKTRFARIQHLKYLAERVEDATHRFNQGFSLTYEAKDLERNQAGVMGSAEGGGSPSRSGPEDSPGPSKE